MFGLAIACCAANGATRLRPCGREGTKYNMIEEIGGLADEGGLAGAKLS
jgi:hypothetical protein